MSIPRVYAAIAAVTGELSSDGIAKRHVNRDDGYDYRSIDDLYRTLSPLLAKHRLCILPRVLKRTETQSCDAQMGPMARVTIRIAFDFLSAKDGFCHRVEAFGEALDAGDKATAKAMTAAYKSAMFQIFCIPVGESEDPDAGSLRRARQAGVVEPVQGWTLWAEEVCQLVACCQTDEAIREVQATNRDLLRALALDQARLFTEIGEAIRERRRSLKESAPSGVIPLPSGPKAASRKREDERRSVNV